MRSSYLYCIQIVVITVFDCVRDEVMLDVQGVVGKKQRESSSAERPVGDRKANVGQFRLGYVERASRTLAEGAGREAW